MNTLQYIILIMTFNVSNILYLHKFFGGNGVAPRSASSRSVVIVGVSVLMALMQSEMGVKIFVKSSVDSDYLFWMIFAPIGDGFSFALHSADGCWATAIPPDAALRARREEAVSIAACAQEISNKKRSRNGFFGVKKKQKHERCQAITNAFQ